MKISLAPAAIADLRRLHAGLAEMAPLAAGKAVISLIRAIQSFDMFPERGRFSDGREFRELIVPFGASGYVLRYAFDSNAGEIVVFRIWHGREARR